MAQFRSIVSAVLREQGRTNAWFWRRMGVSEALFYAIENGTRRPSAEYRARAAQLLQLPESALFLPADLSSESKPITNERKEAVPS